MNLPVPALPPGEKRISLTFPSLIPPTNSTTVRYYFNAINLHFTLKIYGPYKETAPSQDPEYHQSPITIPLSNAAARSLIKVTAGKADERGPWIGQETC